MDPTKQKYNDLGPVPWWMTEFLFWSAFAVASFVVLGLFYGDPTIMSGVNLVFESVLGFLITRPIFLAAPYIQRIRFALRAIILILLVLVLSQAWNAVRMLTFPLFFPGAKIWDEFGGWSFSALLIFAFWTALFYSVRAFKIAATQKELAQVERFRRLEAEKLSSNAQLKMLRYQINPHFIFNTLNSVNALIASNRNKDARLMIDKFSDMLRLTLQQDPPLMVSLADEIDTVQRYLDVEQMRFGARLTTRVIIARGLEIYRVPSLILQPIIENAIRHGVEAQSSPCQISISATKNEDILIISIEDSGPGLKPDSPPRRRESLGLGNVEARLQAVYGDSATITLANAPSRGTIARMCIPLTTPRGAT